MLFFNTAENRSSEWGTQPWHWYLTNALLKSMHVHIILVIVAALNLRLRDATVAALARGHLVRAVTTVLSGMYVDREVLYYITPVTAFMSLYSLLPHKVMHEVHEPDEM